MYGLKQAPRAWYSKLDKSILELGLIRSNHEPAVYYTPSNLYIGVYVDNLLVAGSSKERILEFKDKMKSLFDMTDHGIVKSYLGIQVNQIEGEITLAQSSYARKILSDFKLLECNSSQTPLEVKLMLSQDDSKNLVDSTTFRSLMGSLRYLTHTRPDLMFCSGYLSKYMEKSVEGALHKCQTSPKVCERDSKSWFILQARRRAVSCRLLRQRLQRRFG